MSAGGIPARGFLGVLDRVVDAILVVILTFTTVILVAGVFFRYVLNSSLAWSDEIGGYMLGWMTFMGIYSCFRKGMHLDFDLAVQSLPPALRRAVLVLGDVIMLVFALVMAWLSLRIVMKVGGSFIGSVDIYRGVFLAVLPPAFLLMAVALVSRLAGHRAATAAASGSTT